MKKRLISLLMAMVMVIGLLPIMNVAAAGTVLLSNLDGGWYATHNKAQRHESERAVWTATGESQDGDNKSLYVNYKSYNNNGTLSHVTVCNTGLELADVQVGTYHVSFYVKGKITTASMLIDGWDNNHRKYISNNELIEITDWTKYEYDIAVTDGSKAGFQFIVEGDVNQFYIDNVSITLNDDATNLLNNPSFAGYEVSAPAKTSDLYKWTATPRGGETTAIAKIAEGVSYSGDNSMYIKYKASDYSKKWMIIENDEFKTYDAAPYTLEFYAKGNFSHNEGSSIYMSMGGSWSSFSPNSNSNKGQWKICHMTITDLPDSDPKKAEGWRKYSATFAGISSAFKIVIQSGCELYIDDMSIKASGSGVNLFANPGFEEEAKIIDEVEDPAAGTLNDVKIGWKATEDKDSPLDGVTNIVKETTHFAYEGEKSLYVKYSPVNKDDNGDSLRIENLGFAQAEPNKKYRISFYLKGDYAYKGESYNNDVAFNVALGWAMNDTRIRMSKQTPQTPEDAAKALEGWEKYSFEIDTTGKEANKLISFSLFLMNDCEMYLDNFAVEEKISDGVYSANLLANPGFEEKEKIIEEVEDPADGTLSDVGTGWSVAFQGDTKEDGEGTIVKETTHFAYEGEKSLYVKYSPINRSSSDSLIIQNLGFAQAEPDKTYRVSLYLKGDYVWKGENYNDDIAFTVGLGWAWNNTRIRMSRQTPQTPEEEAKALEGWEKYSFEINTAGYEQSKLIKFSIFLMDYCEMYLDNITLEEKISDGVYSSNLLTNSGFEGVKAYAVLGDLENWTVTPNKTGEISVKTATGVSYSGNNSMHVKTVEGGNYTFVNNSAWSSTIEGDTNTYLIEFYAKGSFAGVEGAPDPFFVMIGWGWGSRIKKITDAKHCTVATPEDAVKASEGWKKYTCAIDTSVAGTGVSPFQLGFAGNCDLYIDDISVKVINSDNTYGENMMVNPGFEGTATDNLSIVGTRLFDADDVAIESISAQGGKEVTTIAYAINNTNDAKTAQIITCLYDGNIMIDSALSAVVNIPADGDAVLMKGVIKLPETIGENYELRVYLWDSLMGMIPLKKTVDVY